MFIVYIISYILIASIILEYITIKKYKKLNEKNKSFLAAISHDLKSPAYAQINMLNLLLKGNFGKLNPEQYEMIKLTCTSSKYMSQLVGNILTNYEYDAKVLKLQKSEFDLTLLIRKICDENKYLANEKGQNIIFNSTIEHCLIYGDELQIERVILNLISNAIKYGFHNTPIIITLEHSNNKIHFRIINQSNPIPPKDMRTIFNKFSKNKNSNIDSSGLGLYIARKIIEMHHGEIYAHSNTEGQCIFEFILNANSDKLTNTNKTKRII